MLELYYLDDIKDKRALKPSGMPKGRICRNG